MSHGWLRGLPHHRPLADVSRALGTSGAQGQVTSDASGNILDGSSRAPAVRPYAASVRTLGSLRVDSRLRPSRAPMMPT